MDELKLADGERVVRTYRCTATDGCRVFAGTAIPTKTARHDSEGTVTVTDRRLICSMETSSKRGGGMIRQEVRISDISSISSIMARFGRDVRVPLMMIVLGAVLMFGPYLCASEAGMFDHGQDYRDGYNDGLEIGYYDRYLDSVIAGLVENTIPSGYVPPEHDEYGSIEYEKGFAAGSADGASRAESVVRTGGVFSVPSDMRMSAGVESAVTIVAVMGAVVFVMGSVLYAISSRTKDWVRIAIGSGSGEGICIKSFSSGEDACGIGPLTASDDYCRMVEEIGSIVAGLRASNGGVKA